MKAPINPKNLEAGTRDITFGRELFIERSDFREQDEKVLYRILVVIEGRSSDLPLSVEILWFGAWKRGSFKERVQYSM